MTLDAFLSRLSVDGVAAVAPEENLTPDERWIAVVREWDAVQRNELAGIAPESLQSGASRASAFPPADESEQTHDCHHTRRLRHG